MEYNNQEPVYELPRAAPPMLWVGLTALFGLCCLLFFCISLGEAALLFGGFNPSSDGSSSGGSKPSFGDVKLYADSGCSESIGRGTVPSVPTTTKTIYVCFTYKNMKTGTPWSSNLTLNGNDVPGASKAFKWTKDASGKFALRLNLDGPLKPGDYELTLSINDEQVQTAQFKVGP